MRKYSILFGTCEEKWDYHHNNFLFLSIAFIPNFFHIIIILYVHRQKKLNEVKETHQTNKQNWNFFIHKFLIFGCCELLSETSKVIKMMATSISLPYSHRKASKQTSFIQCAAQLILESEWTTEYKKKTSCGSIETKWSYIYKRMNKMKERE